MFIKLLLIFLLIHLPIIHSQCYSKSSQIWICNNQSKSNLSQQSTIDYETVLNNQMFEKFYLKNYHLSIFKIDNYPPTLRLLNASNNNFQTIIITSKNRYISNIRQLILQSNHIQYFNINTIILPQSLEIISLANNNLEVLDARIFLNLKNLIKIDLKNNQLKYILPELLLKKTIYLNNNPLDCQCTPEFYRIICEKSTNLKQLLSESNNCMAPYYDSQAYNNTYSPSYLRFSKFILTCPINGQPSPIIIWSTPFGNLTSINSSDIYLLSSNNDEPIYIKLKARAGPLTASTRHILEALNRNQLSITQARAGLQHRLSCSGINMLGIYTYEFNFNIDTYAKKHSLWIMLFTAIFGLVMSLIGGVLCIILKQTYYHADDHLKTPPIYPTMTPNSAARTPPNFELNQWLSSAAANISETLEQVRDRLRLGVQHVSVHMGRASELITHRVQHAGGTIRQAAETSAAYLQSIRGASQHRLNTMRVQTVSSLRSSGNFMRAGMHMLTTQVNSLRDYCGVTTGHMIPSNYLLQQQQLHHMQHSTTAISYVHCNQIPTIIEDDESNIESTALINSQDQTPYAGYISSTIFANTSGIGKLDTADNSVLSALNNFNQNTINILDNEDVIPEGETTGGIGTFHGPNTESNDDLINESSRSIIYGEQNLDLNEQK